MSPDARTAARVEAVGARTARRWIQLRLGRLPAPAARLARAVAVLERAQLPRAAALAELDPAEAAEAADALVAAGILEPERPLAFVHPLVRAGVYEELAGRRALARAPPRGRAHGRRPGRRGARRRAPAGHRAGRRPVDRAAPGRCRAHRGAARRARSRRPCSCAARWPSRRPRPSGPACCSSWGSPRPPPARRRARTTCSEALAGAGDDPEVALGATLVLAHALGRAERLEDAVAVIDRTAARLRDRDEQTAERLETLAMMAGMLDVEHRALARRPRLEALRRRADEPDAHARGAGRGGDARGRRRTSPAEVGDRARAAGLRRRAARRCRRPTDLPWFVQATIALVWADAFDEATRPDRGRPGREPRHRRLRALRDEHGLARVAAAAPRRPAGRRRRRAHGARRRRPSGAAAVPHGGQRASSSPRSPSRATWTPPRPRCGRFAERRADAGARRGAMLLLARGHLRAAQRQLDAGAGRHAARPATSRCASARSRPSSLPWRSEAALVHAGPRRARGARERLAREELELGRVFGAPRTLGVALRAAGVVIGGREGEELLREAAATLDARGRGARERPRAWSTSARCCAAPTAAPTRASCCARASTSPIARARRALADQAEIELRATGAKPRRAHADRPRGAHRQRAARGRARGAGHDQPRDRPGPVRHRPHRRGPPDPDLPEARPALARGPRARAGRADERTTRCDCGSRCSG